MATITVKEWPTVKLEIFAEYFDDEHRSDVIHNHLVECPICHAKNVGTDLFGQSFFEYMEDRQIEDAAIHCQSCHTKFQLLRYDGLASDGSDWMAFKTDPIVFVDNIGV